MLAIIIIIIILLFLYWWSSEKYTNFGLYRPECRLCARSNDTCINGNLLNTGAIGLGAKYVCGCNPHSPVPWLYPEPSRGEGITCNCKSLHQLYNDNSDSGMHYKRASYMDWKTPIITRDFCNL